MNSTVSGMPMTSLLSFELKPSKQIKTYFPELFFLRLLARAMGEPIRMRIREGCRGGQEQFRWNSVKDQDFKDREQYLGQSTKVGMMGKFGRYYLHDWYAQKRESVESIDQERSAIQAYEEELMQEALGIKPKKLILAKDQLSPEELKDFLKRDKPEGQRGREQMGPQRKVVHNEMGEQVEGEDLVGIAAREAPIKGLGFAAHRTAKLEAIKAEALRTVGELTGSASQSSSAKMEVKEELGERHCIKVESKQEAALVKEEPIERPAKRPFEETKTKEHKQRKTEKLDKKLKKAEKKLKKQEKRAKKAAKEARRAAGKAIKRSPSSSSCSDS